MDKKLYSISLPDYSVPPIVSGATKEYVGAKEDINKVVHNDEAVLTKEGVVIAEKTFHCLAAEMTFINTYGFDHTIKTDKIEALILYFYDGKKYIRCIEARMKNLHPGVLYIENDWVCSNLYAVERVFKNKEACLSDINHASPLNFDCFFNNIFGAG